MNKIFSAIVLLFCGISAYSQDKTPIEYGIEHSFNLTSLRGSGGPIEYVNRAEHYKLTGNRSTLDLGMFAIIHASELLAFQPELVYSSGGGHFQKETVVYHDLGAIRGVKDLSFKFEYLKLNLVANIKVGTGLYFQLGGYGSSTLSAKLSYPWYLLNTTGEDESILGDIESTDFGIIAGMGLSTKVVNIALRYNHGLVDVFQSGEYEELSLNNRALQLVFHWKLRSDLR